ncbi:MAG: phosphatidylglycerophosphatase A [Magnetococcales bacterium]|nr:phosphatidylglycerophosphatase A [Magnetococcales bacterium]
MTARWDRLASAIATLGGVGRARRAPGTMGTLASVPVAALLQLAGPAVLAAGLVVVIVAGTWAAEVVCRTSGRKDPREVVVDEMAGYLLTILLAPTGWIWLGVGFALFRLFDIGKPWPVSVLERLPGGWGVMADDLAAGLLAGLIIMLVVWSGLA